MNNLKSNFKKAVFFIILTHFITLTSNQTTVKIPVLATGSSDNTIKIWNFADPESPRLIKILKGHKEAILSIKTSPHSKKIIASASQDGEVKIWDISKPNGKECIKTLTGEESNNYCFSFDQFNKNMLAYSYGGNSIKIFNIFEKSEKENDKKLVNNSLVNYSQVKNITLNGLAINSISFDPFTKDIIAFSTTRNNSIMTLDLSKPTGKQLSKVIKGSTELIKFIFFSQFEKNKLISVSVNGTIKIWDLTEDLTNALKAKRDKYKCINTFETNCDIISAEINPFNKNQIAYLTTYPELDIKFLNTSKKRESSKSNPTKALKADIKGLIQSIAFDPYSKNILVAGNGKGKVVVHDITKKDPIKILENAHNDYIICSVAFAEIESNEKDQFKSNLNDKVIKKQFTDVRIRFAE